MMSQTRVFIVDGTRTPFLKARTEPGLFAASDLSIAAGRSLLARMPFDATALDEVVIGCVIPAPEEANIARVVGLRLGCGEHVPAYSVQRNCGSGLQAVASAVEHIRLGQAQVVLAGGTEAMSRAPIQWNTAMAAWLGGVLSARRFSERVRALARFRPSHLQPVYSLLLGLSDPVVKLSMGQTAEVLAHSFGISREMQDAYALQSHRRLAAWFDGGYAADEVDVLYEPNGKFHTEDTGLRRDTDMAQLARLKPAFDRKYGQVTSGNSSQVSDGAAMLVVASEDAVRRHQLPVLGEWLDHDWAGVDPRQMGLGPVHAVAKILGRHGMKMRDLAQLELNEAFAAQVLACQAAWDSADYARKELGLAEPLGAIDPDRLNPEGGAIACGHPVGTSGARLVLHLLRSLKRKGGGTGMAALCIGGGQGGAMLLRSGGAA
jgi:acetyl-CoA C-acetyltransferase